ncbi:MAG: NAD(P)/FAD-dependent oxidoreductase, partial [Clostridia bacterium]|nr:NAD(P)/FAD-dependent oxidoreductase [Clostridia bacterium]
EKEHDVATGASRANSGIVHAGFDCKEGSLKAKLNVKGSLMMEELCAEMGVSYDRCGSVVVGFGEEDDQTVKELYQRGLANGVGGLSIKTGDEARALEPSLSGEVTSALFADTGAIVCPYELTIAAMGVAIYNGAVLQTGAAVKALTKKDGVWHIESEAGHFESTYLVNCAGVYSDEVAKMAGETRFSVHARRGEYFLLDKASGLSLKRTVFMAPSKMGKGVLVSPTAHGNIIVGPTAEDIEKKDSVQTTASGLAQVRSLSQKSVPATPLRKAITSFCGLRAVGNTGDFIIEQKEGVVHCIGIESPGLSASPAIAKYVASLLEKAGALLKEKADFNGAYRPAVAFRSLTDEQKNEIIRKDSRYGRIVCRCETVTEGEIVETLHKEPKPKTLDALKRRTRCGMGRCQGGFCTPVVTEIMAKELGISELEVTKSGGTSRLLAERTKA